MNKRHQFLIEPFKDQIKNSNDLDLASHDGRWCYAFAGAGAKNVTSIEARAELVSHFQEYPDSKLREKVDLNVGDLFEFIDGEVCKKGRI